MAEKIEKRIEEVCERMLFSARSELYLHLRFLDVALSMFSYALEPNLETIGSDGRIIYYNPAYLGGIYRQGRVMVNRAYLHIVFHCIFAHPWKDTRIRKKRAGYELGIKRESGQEDLTDLLWDISCDIAVERMIDDLYLHCIRKPLSPFRKETYEWLKKEKSVLNAESIFSALVHRKTDEAFAGRLKQEFEVDEHRIWRERNRQNQRQNPKEDWDDIREKMQTEMESFGDEKDNGAGQSMLEKIKAENRERHDYRQFLKKFAVLKEEQQIDADAFDYGFYAYGLSLYGNMPLIEPLETKEVKKVEEFIIAIDTSMSCSGELVKRFLEETWSILRETDSFFHTVNIHIIQCDEAVRRDDKITSKEELEEYMKNLEIEGKGGTDFVPVFTYVQELLRRKEFSNLRGLLYFTDGKGRFPKKMPPYQTAFVLVQKEFEEVEVPPWAIRIYQTEEDGYGLGEKRMNIKRAKNEIKDAIEAYLLKDEYGNYLIPEIRQRPLLLMGPPGIGKTQIMEQIARETKINLVSYTITHHTRQSAVGLPFIKEKVYDNKAYSVTEYTMSEIIASVYEQIEKTGIKEGILFIDEINCVSETLAPTMLQFLQCKTFGNQAVPKGWVIVAAGNPPEYNKSVREFDVVTLDRIRRIDVEEDFQVWKEYAYQAGIHPAILAYLEIHKQNFYRMETSVDGRLFVTARGWEDLSQFLYAYERLEKRADREVIGQYLQYWKIAKDFANYLELFEKYKTDYRIEAVLEGRFEKFAIDKLKIASFDEKLSVVGLLIGHLGKEFYTYYENDLFVTELFERLKKLKQELENDSEETAGAILENRITKEQERFEKKEAAKQLTVPQRTALVRMFAFLKTVRNVVKEEEEKGTQKEEIFEVLAGLFKKETEKREEQIEQTSQKLQYAFDFLELVFGEGQELVLFVTELNTNPYSVSFISENGCDSYYKYNKKLLFEEEQGEILKELNQIEEEM